MNDSPSSSGVNSTTTLPDFELFWEEHRQKFVIATLVSIVCLLIGGGVLLWNHAQTTASEALFFSATNKSEWEKVVARYPHSSVAGLALLLIAQAESTEHQNEAAKKTYQRFLEQFPHHPLAVNGLLGKAMLDDATGNTQAAVDEFQQAATAYASSYGAPFALMMESRILIRLRKTEEAKRLLQLIASQYPDSLTNTVFASKAGK